MSTLILPICGESTRYPNQPPKWSIVHRGKTMLEHSVAGIPLDFFDDVVVIILEKHLDLYTKLNVPYKIIALPKQTANQAETVYQGITKNRIKGHIVIKDCDNYFKVQPIRDNFVAYFPLSGDVHNAENKSYIEINVYGLITNIIEKITISNTFCCGMYGFANSDFFCKTYEQNPKYVKFISDIILYQLLNNQIFIPVKVKDYVDWGTLKDWQCYIERSEE